MKLKIGDKVYLQKYEVLYILRYMKGKVPYSIIDESFIGDKSVFYITGPTDSFQFEGAYEKPENVKWLMERDCFVDYDKYVEMSIAELEALCDRLKTEYSAGIKEFNDKDETYRKAHYEEMNEKINHLKHKYLSLTYLIGFRKGECEFTFPDGYQGKTTFPGAPSAISTSQKKPSFFARLFGRSAQ